MNELEWGRNTRNQNKVKHDIVTIMQHYIAKSGKQFKPLQGGGTKT
jgi:hypothetical protein